MQEHDSERLRGDLRTVGVRFAHDIRAPLNCIATAGEALGKIPAGSESDQAVLAQAVLGSVAEIAVMMERVSFVLKATADPQPLRPLAMGEVAWAALQRLESRARRQGAAIEQPDSWPHVEGVHSWLEVIWENLIGNSLVHGGPSPRIELGWVRDSSEYLFRVRDHGAGVPPERRPRLFMPFDELHRLDAPRGLGLPIVRRLVEMQGGRCFHEAPLGGGACFFFTLPA